jgi:hypothetical protein
VRSGQATGGGEFGGKAAGGAELGGSSAMTSTAVGGDGGGDTQQWPCDYCKEAVAVLHCRADAARLAEARGRATLRVLRRTPGRRTTTHFGKDGDGDGGISDLAPALRRKRRRGRVERATYGPQ